jgi:hypothetical protein
MSRPDKEAEWADGLVPAHIVLLGWALSLNILVYGLDVFCNSQIFVTFYTQYSIFIFYKNKLLLV